MDKIEFTKIKHDVNGNPRYVCHFLNLNTEQEKNIAGVSWLYQVAVKRANKIGGRKYHTRGYGGGIVFQSYNIAETERSIKAIVAMDSVTRLSELQEIRQEFILNESIFADDHPSWGEVADAEAEAESRWEQTAEGQELKKLESDND